MTPVQSQRMAKSNSLSVLEHDTDMHIVDQDDIIGLTQDVKYFSDGLARLKGLFTEQCGRYTCYQRNEERRGGGASVIIVLVTMY